MASLRPEGRRKINIWKFLIYSKGLTFWRFWTPELSLHTPLPSSEIMIYPPRKDGRLSWSWWLVIYRPTFRKTDDAILLTSLWSHPFTSLPFFSSLIPSPTPLVSRPFPCLPFPSSRVLPWKNFESAEACRWVIMHFRVKSQHIDPLIVWPFLMSKVLFCIPLWPITENKAWIGVLLLSRNIFFIFVIFLFHFFVDAWAVRATILKTVVRTISRAYHLRTQGDMKQNIAQFSLL